MIDALPDWPQGTVTVLSTGAGAPHAIPVSAAIRRGPRELALALALRRESLVRLREDPRCALTVIAEAVAVTALGTATVVRETKRVAFVRLDVEEVQDHDRPTFALEEGVRWHWTPPRLPSPCPMPARACSCCCTAFA